MCIKVKDVGSFLFWLTSPMDVSYTMHSKGFKKKLVIWKGNETTVTKTWASPECSLQGMMLKLKLQYFGHLMGRVDSLEKTLMLFAFQTRCACASPGISIKCRFWLSSSGTGPKMLHWRGSQGAAMEHNQDHSCRRQAPDNYFRKKSVQVQCDLPYHHFRNLRALG